MSGTRAGDAWPPPEEHEQASGALDDTVADVDLGEQLDELEAEDAAAQSSNADEDAPVEEIRRIPQRGMFGWSIGGEVLFWGILSLVGLAAGIMAAFLHPYPPEIYIWGGVTLVVAPYSLFRLRKAWPRWTQGRPFIEALTESLGGD